MPLRTPPITHCCRWYVLCPNSDHHRRRSVVPQGIRIWCRSQRNALSLSFRQQKRQYAEIGARQERFGLPLRNTEDRHASIHMQAC